MGSDGRGVDNSVDGWATDYLLFCAMFMFACRLFFLKHCSAESALTQLFQSGGYLFGALGHHVFPNRAFDSPCGDHYFYWVWIAAYTCQGLSCICWLKWADRFLHFNKGAWRWTRIPMALCLGIAVVSVGTIDFGSAWCLSQPEAALVDTSKYLFFSYDAVEQLTGTSAVEQGGVRHQPASERFDHREAAALRRRRAVRRGPLLPRLGVCLAARGLPRGHLPPRPLRARLRTRHGAGL